MGSLLKLSVEWKLVESPGGCAVSTLPWRLLIVWADSFNATLSGVFFRQKRAAPFSWQKGSS